MSTKNKSSKRTMSRMLLSLVLCSSLVLVFVLSPAGCGRSPQEVTKTEFKHGKTMWLLMPYVGEYWWNTIVNAYGIGKCDFIRFYGFFMISPTPSTLKNQNN